LSGAFFWTSRGCRENETRKNVGGSGATAVLGLSKEGNTTGDKGLATKEGKNRGGGRSEYKILVAGAGKKSAIGAKRKLYPKKCPAAIGGKVVSGQE